MSLRVPDGSYGPYLHGEYIWECMKYDSKRARARSRPRFTSSSGDSETLCVNGSKRGYRSFCTRVRGLNAYV